jgi:nucleotide-binding universal stress UspA family protein
MKILIAIDSSNYGEEILNEVERYGWPQTTEFKLLMVIAPCDLLESEKKFQQTSRILLDTRVNVFKNKMPSHKVSSQVLEGLAAKTIVDAAEDWRADWIVIGSRGESGPHKSAIGSVAADVMTQAFCSVQLIKVRNVTKSVLEENLLQRKKPEYV